MSSGRLSLLPQITVNGPPRTRPGARVIVRFAAGSLLESHLGLWYYQA